MKIAAIGFTALMIGCSGSQETARSRSPEEHLIGRWECTAAEGIDPVTRRPFAGTPDLVLVFHDEDKYTSWRNIDEDHLGWDEGRYILTENRQIELRSLGAEEKGGYPISKGTIRIDGDRLDVETPEGIQYTLRRAERALATTQDGKRIIVLRPSRLSAQRGRSGWGYGRAAALVNRATGAEEVYFDASSGPVMGAALAEKRGVCLLAVSDWGGGIRVFDLRTGREDDRYRGGWQMWIGRVGLSPDERFVVTGGGDGTVCLWDLDNPSFFAQVQPMPGDGTPETRDPALEVGFEDNGATIAVRMKSGKWNRYALRDYLSKKRTWDGTQAK